MQHSHKNRKNLRTLSVEQLQSRQMLAADLAMAVDAEFDLDVSGMQVEQARVGQEISFDLISSGAAIQSPGGNVRFQLDPDVDQTPGGATMTEDGLFHWTPTQDQVGNFTFTVIAVNRDNFCEADAERFSIEVQPLNEVPELSDVPDHTIARGSELAVEVTASDPNEGDTLTLEVIDGPQGVSVEQVDGGQWIVHWMPDPSTPPGTFEFQLQVSEGELSDVAGFSVDLTNAASSVDLNGPTATGTQSEVTFVEGQGSVAVAPDVTIADPDDAMLQSALVHIDNPMNGAAENLSVDTSDTKIVASYDSETGSLTLTGEDTVENYQQVLATLRYDNESQDPHECPRVIHVSVDDGWDASEAAVAIVDVVGVNQGPNLILPAPYDDESTPVEVVVGTELAISTIVQDPDSIQFKYLVDLDGSDLPADASQPMISSNGEFAWTPDTPGTFAITLIALDDHGAADQETFTVTVTGNSEGDTDSGPACEDTDSGSAGEDTDSGPATEDTDSGTANQDTDSGTANQDTDGGPTGEDDAPGDSEDEGETPADPNDLLYAHDRDSQLFTVNVDTGEVIIIAQMSEQMFDIAFDNDGNLFGISHDGGLYSVNPETAQVSLIGSTGTFINALEFSPGGELYGAGNLLYSIDPATGAAISIGDLSGFTSDGDLAFAPDGRLLLAAKDDQLVEVDPTTGAAALIGDIVQPATGSLDILGLDFHANGSLYGFSNDQNSVVLINPATGAAQELVSFADSGLNGVYGASFYQVKQAESDATEVLLDQVFASYDPLELESLLMDAMSAGGNLGDFGLELA